MRVFTPETYKTNLRLSELAEGVYKEMVGYKHRDLEKSLLGIAGRICDDGDCCGLLPEIPGDRLISFA